MKKILQYIIIFILIVTILMGLLVLSCSFSSSKIYENVKDSSEVLLSEGNRKIVYIPYRGARMQFDNYSDALMINTAYSIDNSTPLYSAFVARKNYIPNVTTQIYEDTAGELRSSSKYKYHNEVGELNDLVNGEEAESFEYARYWHGYLIILRPLLLLFNLSQIRIILTVLLIVLAIILLYLIYKKINLIVAIIFFTGLLGVEYFYLGVSLQGVFVFFIMIISSIIILLKYENIKNKCIFFFIIGILTNFFDFLTVPIVTLFIPLILNFLLMQKYEKNIGIKIIIKDIIKDSIMWVIGYGLTWFSKWLLTDLIFNKNLISTAIQQVFYRSRGTAQYNMFDVINNNIVYLYLPFFISLICTILLIRLNIKKYINKQFNKKVLIEILPYVIMSIAPFVWYILLQNHSYNHAFFTYRNLLITNICINLYIERFLNNEGYNEK